MEDVLAYLADSEQRLDEIEFASDRIETLKNGRRNCKRKQSGRGEILREKRLSAAQAMESRICDELRQLDMPKIRFVCEFTPQQPMQTGLDSVRF